MGQTITPTELIGRTVAALVELPACVAGSSVAAETYGLPLGQFADVDVFCYTQEAMMVGVARLQAAGYKIEDRHARVWDRWLKFGISKWHTNSIKMHAPDGAEVNLIVKKTNGQVLSSLSSV